MKDRPILFSAPMVRSILAGTKTQTRRIAPIAELNIKQAGDDVVTWGVHFTKPIKGVTASHSGGKFTDLQVRSIIASQFCHRFQPSDRLWVRETFAIEKSVESGQPLPHNDGRPVQRRPADDYECAHPEWRQAHYRATDPAPELVYEEGPAGGREDEIGVRWKPSIHMPRWASRIALEITAVRVERLQDISEDDAQAEGCAYSERFRGYCVGEAEHFNSNDPRQSYFSLWQSINGPGSVEANPWVWAVEFKHLKGQQ